MTRTTSFYLALAAILLSPIAANADPISVAAGVSSGTLQEDFSTVPGGASASFSGTNVSAAESFVGLTVNDPGGSGFESYSGTPTNPLALDIGAASDGIWNIQGVAGLAGGTGAQDIGEGVIAFLFDFDILGLGLDINGATPNSGLTTFFFYASDGSLVDTIATALIGSISFSSTQVFRGVAIQNTDPGGQAYDNLRFDAASVPEPGTLALLGIGLFGMGLARRRKMV